jgi:tRNA (guanosine-2'-O-)-methyltransferase
MENTGHSAHQAHDDGWYAGRIEYLREFMLPERYDNFRRVIDRRTRWMTVCMENTFHAQNASALVRNCEAFGIQDIHAIENLCPFQPNVDIVRGTDKWVDLHHYKDSRSALSALKAEGYRIVATTPHRDDRSPESFDVAKGKFALVFGTEHAGISEEVAAAADEFIRIPMCGFVESLNVSASAAILLHALSSRLRESGAPWQLTESEKLPILFEWIMGSIRNAEHIITNYELRITNCNEPL